MTANFHFSFNVAWEIVQKEDTGRDPVVYKDWYKHVHHTHAPKALPRTSIIKVPTLSVVHWLYIYQESNPLNMGDQGIKN